MRQVEKEIDSATQKDFKDLTRPFFIAGAFGLTVGIITAVLIKWNRDLEALDKYQDIR